jgi:hypothetical protein
MNPILEDHIVTTFTGRQWAKNSNGFNTWNVGLSTHIGVNGKAARVGIYCNLPKGQKGFSDRMKML